MTDCQECKGTGQIKAIVDHSYGEWIEYRSVMIPCPRCKGLKAAETGLANKSEELRRSVAEWQCALGPDFLTGR